MTVTLLYIGAAWSNLMNTRRTTLACFAAAFSAAMPITLEVPTAGALPAQLPAACDGSIESPATRFVVDDCGRVVILRGTNVESSSKGARQSDSHLPQSDRELQTNFNLWGWNSVRFLVFWGAIEPAPGVFDDAYLDQVEEWVDWYESRGIHVVLDMHQDLYGWAVNGNGAPDWAVDTDGLTYVGVPGAWWLSATDPATQAAYQNFWDLSKGKDFRAHYLASLKYLARRFADHPAVIGYDIMNEPGFANGDLDATLAIWEDAANGNFKNPNLTQFMQQGIEAIRSEDPDNWIGIEPTSLINAFPYATDLMMEQLTDVREGPSRLLYAGHLYEPSVHEGTGYSTDSTYLADWEAFRTTEATALDSSLWIGECGGQANQDRSKEYFQELTAMSDRAMAGWATWSWDPSSTTDWWAPITDTGEITINGQSLQRVQPSAIAGTPTFFNWDPVTRVFTMHWAERAQAMGPTEIALPLDL